MLHKERAARAAYVQAAEQYRSTVLTAFQNVADTLNALEQDANALKAAAAAKDAAEHHPGPGPETMAVRLRQLPGAVKRGTDLSARQ